MTFIKRHVKVFTDYFYLEGFKRYFSNTSWLFIARVVNLITSFLILAIIARYLGPSNYGILSFAVSFTGLFAFIATLGLDQILYRELVREPENHYKLIGTAFYLRLISSIVACTSAILTSIILGHSHVTTFIITLMSSAFLFQGFAVINYQFQAQVKAKYTSLGSIVVVFLLSLLKLGVVFLDKGVIYFSAIYLIESLLYTFVFIYCYNKINYSIKFWYFDAAIARSMLRDAWPLILASGLAFVYARIDQVMINEYTNTTNVGLYDTAVRLAEIWHFIPLLIISSIFPAIINSKQTDFKLYKKRIRDLMLFLVGLAIIFATPLSLLSETLIRVIFGSEYLAGSTALVIYVWGGIGFVITAVFNQVLIADNKTNIIFVVSIIGAVLNIILNMIFIPQLGINGAALATLMSYNMTALILMIYFCYKFKRPVT